MRTDMAPKLLAILAFAALMAGLTPAFAQSDSIVINEIDINPPGDDSKTITEWVELYNPTGDDVYIGEWQVASSGFRQPLVIPAGTTIPAGSFQIFLHTTLWFPNTGSIAYLHDASGMPIDQTPPLTDLQNDHLSWQRIRDGYGSSIGDWKFEPATINTRNGQIDEVLEQRQLTVTLSTDKPEYVFGEYAVISGDVSEKISVEKPIFGVATIEMTVNGPGYARQFSLYPDAQLNYETQISLQEVLGVRHGTYNVSVEYAGSTAQAQFLVGDPAVITDRQDAGKFSVFTDADSYIPGQTIKLSGNLTRTYQFEGVQFQVYNPDGAKHFGGALYPDSSGRFSTDLFTSRINPIFGTYSVTAEYFGLTAESSFELAPELIEDVPISLSTDSEVYDIGDTVVISGRLNNIWIPSLDIEIEQISRAPADSEAASDGTVPEERDGRLDTLVQFFTKKTDLTRLAGDSTFEYEFDIVNDPNRYGEYRVKVSQDVGTAQIFFRVTENATAYTGDETTPLTVRTDRASYDLGDTFTITGKVNKIFTSSTFHTNLVSIKISEVGGSTLKTQEFKARLGAAGIEPVVYSLTAVPDSGGNFLVEDTLHRRQYSPGMYVIEASYAADKYKARDTFTVTDSLDIGEQYRIDLNKEVFGLDETVTVDGIFSGLAQAELKIVLHKPDGDIDEFGALTENSRFSWSWQTPIAEKTQTVSNERGTTMSNYGVYKAVFKTNSQNVNVFFKVSPNPEADTLRTQPVEVTTDRQVYNAGTNMVISGTAQKRDQGQEGLVTEDRVKISVKQAFAPLRELYTTFLYLDNGGNFETELNLPVTIFGEGKYKITAFYNKHRSTASFSVDNELKYGGDEKLALIIGIDKENYMSGETVHITGRLNKLVHLEKIDLTILHEEKAQSICGNLPVCGSAGSTVTLLPSSAGMFEYDYTIGSEPEDLGSYRILADVAFGTFESRFTVGDPPAEPEPQALRVIEKFNRILDDAIAINSVISVQNGTELAPRVIQGSLFTTARGQEASVNLRVVTGNGTCVIGPGCLVSESTRTVQGIYKTADIDGKSYNIRYSGPDAILEKFSVLPADDTIHIGLWNVEILKDDQPSRFYYKITRVSQE